MRIATRKCVECHENFIPNARLGARQKTCGSPDCKRKRNHHCQKDWKRKNRDVCRENQRNWCKANPNYWQNYRKNHPCYTLRNRKQAALRKRIGGLGLQRKLDILEVPGNSMEFWSLPKFAKSTRSLIPLLCAYASQHEITPCRSQSAPP